MPDIITAAERALIDAAVAAGRVTRIPCGVVQCMERIGRGKKRRRCTERPAPGYDVCAAHIAHKSWRVIKFKGR